jgi:hypothetical protein
MMLRDDALSRDSLAARAKVQNAGSNAIVAASSHRDDTRR